MDKPYQYRVQDVMPGVEWREGWRGQLEGARFPYVPYHWRKAWACLRHAHRYHRSRQAAVRCAGIIEPRTEIVQIIAGEVTLDG